MLQCCNPPPMSSKVSLLGEKFSVCCKRCRKIVIRQHVYMYMRPNLESLTRWVLHSYLGLRKLSYLRKTCWNHSEQVLKVNNGCIWISELHFATRYAITNTTFITVRKQRNVIRSDLGDLHHRLSKGYYLWLCNKHSHSHPLFGISLHMHGFYLHRKIGWLESWHSHTNQ
jgi:hypothetical protein